MIRTLDRWAMVAPKLLNSQVGSVFLIKMFALIDVVVGVLAITISAIVLL